MLRTQRERIETRFFCCRNIRLAGAFPAHGEANAYGVRRFVVGDLGCARNSHQPERSRPRKSRGIAVTTDSAVTPGHSK
jgi:hypothetical protein